MQDIVFLEYTGDSLKRTIDLFHRVCGHEREADESIGGCNGRRNHRIHEDAFFEKVARDGKCLEVVTDEERDDGGRGVTDLKSA